MNYYILLWSSEVDADFFFLYTRCSKKQFIVYQINSQRLMHLIIIDLLYTQYH